MTGEFTGERVVPGLVEPDLWNEHFARYAFVRAVAEGKRVLDLGCGTGYGSRELALAAASVVGVDIAREAVGYAHGNFTAENLRFVQAACTQLPFRNASFDAIACFEVIEHLADWPALLAEARRVLAPGGVFIVSTPNKSFYAESRTLTGPNPYHVHEFEYAEFAEALGAMFPHVTIYLENHVAGVAVLPAQGPSDVAVQMGKSSVDPGTANFFLAACSDMPQAVLPALVYIPEASNMLREKTLHITLLEQQVRKHEAEHAALLRLHEEQEQALLRSNKWAADTNAELQETRALLTAEQNSARSMAAGYEAQIAKLQAELEERTRWGMETQAELAKCADLLNKAEASVVERTEWALSLDSQRQRLEAALAAVRSSRWMRAGRAVGLGPELEGY